MHGRISKTGRAHTRGVLVEAAWSATRAPGPLRAFYHRVQARRGFQKAVVATARKLTILAWHLAVKDQDYAFARPSLVARTNGASSSSPPVPHLDEATTEPQAPGTTTRPAARPRPWRPNGPSTPTS